MWSDMLRRLQADWKTSPKIQIMQEYTGLNIWFVFVGPHLGLGTAI